MVVDPDRVVNGEGHLREFLAVARGTLEPGADVLAQLCEARRGSLVRRRKKRRPADMHVGGRAFDGEERAVQRGQSRGAHSLPRTCAVSGSASSKTNTSAARSGSMTLALKKAATLRCVSPSTAAVKRVRIVC